MQVILTRLIKHQDNMAPVGPQDGTGGPTSGLPLSCDPLPLQVWQQSRDLYPLLVQWPSHDLSPTSRSAGVTSPTPVGHVTLPSHTGDLPRPTQVVPIRITKPLGKMAPARIQDGAGRTTSGLAAVV